MSRTATIVSFLDANGWAGSIRHPLAGDASARRYERITRGADTAVLMDIDPDSDLKAEPFISIGNWLHSEGFSTPEIYAGDVDAGLLLLEDLGNDLFMTLCNQDAARANEIYPVAIDTLSALQNLTLPGPGAAWSPPPYDMAVLIREAKLLVDWYIPASIPGSRSDDLMLEFAGLAEQTFNAIPPAVPTIVYRDYHAENLIWLPEREHLRRVGLLDFQDMLAGHPAYDLVSLLADARRDTGSELRRAMTDRYIEQNGVEREPFLLAAHILSAQRNMKIMGLFTRLARRDGKRGYVALLPRVWKHLVQDISHPELSRLKNWIDRHVPPPDQDIQRKIAGVSQVET